MNNRTKFEPDYVISELLKLGGHGVLVQSVMSPAAAARTSRPEEKPGTWLCKFLSKAAWQCLEFKSTKEGMVIVPGIRRGSGMIFWYT